MRESIAAAFKYSIPVLLGYFAVGIAFGLLAVEQGYPWWLVLVMSVIMYAGAGQFVAVGLFAAGTTLVEAVLVQLVVNLRHMAYGLFMLKRFNRTKGFKYYLIFALTDETFSLLSSLPDKHAQGRFMFLVALLDHAYWVIGTLVGAVAGSVLPFNIEGIEFSLTALFVVLMIEQMLRVRKARVFIVSALVAILVVVFLPSRFSLLSALVIALALAQLIEPKEAKHDADP
jgi:4-azaleucine resistance transporter AzlC